MVSTLRFVPLGVFVLAGPLGAMPGDATALPVTAADAAPTEIAVAGGVQVWPDAMGYVCRRAARGGGARAPDPVAVGSAPLMV